MMTCGACSRGAVGLEGHLDLFVLKLQGNRIQFYCRTCSTLWVRTRADEGYRWAVSARELDTAPVPGSQPSADR
jgi:hypothetical protein